MFFLSKLFNHLLLPPGILILLIVLALFFYLFKRPRVFWILLYCSLGLFYLFSIEPVQDFFLRPLESRYPPLSSEKSMDAQFVVVLGGGVIAGSPEENRGSSPSRSALKRLVYGLRIAQSLKLPLILTGGSAYPADYTMETEAESGARILRELGLQEVQVYMETTSRNTWENSRNVKDLYHPDTIILVTSAFHMSRSMLSFRKQGITAVPAPTDYRINYQPYTYRSYLPSAAALEGVHIGLKEYFGLFYYMLRR